MESFVRPLKARNGWLKALPVGLSLLLLARSAGAQYLDTFNVGSGVPADNNANPLVDYSTPIWATNFFNDSPSTFSWNLGSSTAWLASLYQGFHGTLNFTNLGEMDSTTGFRFDTLISSHAGAGSFYNNGSINCGTSAGAVFLNFFQIGLGYYGGYGGIYVNATNIVNPGFVNIGADGGAKFYGNNVDFSGGSVSIQSSTNFFFYSGLGRGLNQQPGVYATGQTGIDTNIWSPINSLYIFFAESQFMNYPPYYLFLFNSLPYFDVHHVAPTNVVVRMIFLQDDSTNVTSSVHFGGFVSSANDGGGQIEWTGNYVNPVTGVSYPKYLYLFNDYMQGSSSNILSYSSPGVPGNYTIYQTDTPLSLNPAQPPSWPFLFPTGPIPDGTVTNNIYSYVDASLITTTVSTNGTGIGSIALTNMPGRIEISATNALNLSGASLSGMNYLLLRSTNQFLYDAQYPISAPFSDLYLGSSSGSIAITNLIQSSIPLWSGSVQAWTTRWLFADTNGIVNGTNVTINYDFRVLLVHSQVAPASTSQEQDVVLYSPDNVVISDQLNIFRTFSLNCTNLLLTTNGVGNGAGSPEGELNLNSSAISWAASVPRLSCLTNNGAIRTLTFAAYGSPASPYLALVNNNLISNGSGAAIYANDFENNSAFFSAGTGAFSVQAQTITITNSVVQAGNAFSAAAASLVIGGTSIQAGRSLTLAATNLLTDAAGTNANLWSLGGNNSGNGNGLVLSALPAAGDLLGTTITNLALVGKINNLWAGQDRGYSTAGFKNNAALGQLVLDAQASGSRFNFAGTGTNNALYVDCLQLLDFASYTNRNGTTNLPALTFSNNLVIYYAQALSYDGVHTNLQTVAEKINGWNTNHLRWVPSYAGQFSSVALVYPDGTTNLVNAALAASSTIDSDGDGIVNSADATPVLVPSQLGFVLTTTNNPLRARLQWSTIPNATNYIEFKTNLFSSSWLPLTNFNNFYYGPGTAVANPAHVNWFASPQPYPGPATNVWVFDPVTNVPHYYRITVVPWLTYPH